MDYSVDRHHGAPHHLLPAGSAGGPRPQPTHPLLHGGDQAPPLHRPGPPRPQVRSSTWPVIPAPYSPPPSAPSPYHIPLGEQLERTPPHPTLEEVSGVTDILQQLEDEASGRGGEEDPGEEEAEEGRAEVGGGEEEVQAGGGEVEEVTEGSALEVQGLEEFEAAEEEEVQRELQEEVQEEVRGVACRTPGTRRRPRLQSQATPAGGSMLDLEHMSGTVSRSHLFLRSSSHISYPT